MLHGMYVEIHRFYCIYVPRFETRPTLRVFTIIQHSHVSKELSFVVVAFFLKMHLYRVFQKELYNFESL